jgi:hypothetical protein
VVGTRRRAVPPRLSQWPVHPATGRRAGAWSRRSSEGRPYGRTAPACRRTRLRPGWPRAPRRCRRRDRRAGDLPGEAQRLRDRRSRSPGRAATGAPGAAPSRWAPADGRRPLRIKAILSRRRSVYDTEPLAGPEVLAKIGEHGVDSRHRWCCLLRVGGAVGRSRVGRDERLGHVGSFIVRAPRWCGGYHRAGLAGMGGPYPPSARH